MNLFKKIISWPKKKKDDQSEIVRYLVSKTADLALDIEDIRLLPPYEGMWGCIAVMGNSLPVYVYSVFSEKHQEFVSVRVEISLPARIHFRAYIPVKLPNGTIREGMYQEVDADEEFKKPFFGFVKAIRAYFPLVATDRDRVPHIIRSKILGKESA